MKYPRPPTYPLCYLPTYQPTLVPMRTLHHPIPFYPFPHPPSSPIPIAVHQCPRTEKHTEGKGGNTSTSRLGQVTPARLHAYSQSASHAERQRDSQTDRQIDGSSPSPSLSTTVNDKTPTPQTDWPTSLASPRLVSSRLARSVD